MAEYLSAMPAYGRDYHSKREVQEAWDAGQDFLIQDFRLSGYVNIADKPEGLTLNIRYHNGTKIHVIK